MKRQPIYWPDAIMLPFFSAGLLTGGWWVVTGDLVPPGTFLLWWACGIVGWVIPDRFIPWRRGRNASR